MDINNKEIVKRTIELLEEDNDVMSILEAYVMDYDSETMADFKIVINSAVEGEEIYNKSKK